MDTIIKKLVGKFHNSRRYWHVVVPQWENCNNTYYVLAGIVESHSGEVGQTRLYVLIPTSAIDTS